MTQRSPIVVLLLIAVTFGIYGIVWLAKSRGEMVARGAQIPTTWALIVPIFNLVYLFKWSKGVEHVTGGRTNGVTMFLLMWLVSIVGYPYAQAQFNTVGATASVQPFPQTV